MKLEELINKNGDYSDIEKRLLEYIFQNQETVANMKVSELARKNFTSPASITRLCQKLGFNGFSEFKYFLKSQYDTNESKWSSNYELLRNDIVQTLNIVHEIDFTPIIKVIENANQIYTFGTDWGERLAFDYLRRNFLLLGLRLTEIPSVTELRWISEKIRENDLIFIISYSGKNLELLELVKVIKILGGKVIAITPLSKNLLSTLTDFNLYYFSTELSKNTNNNKVDLNMFTTLHIVLDILFRKYYDYQLTNELTNN